MVAIKSVFLLLALGVEALAASSPSATCTSKYGTVSIASNKIPRATTSVQTKVTVIRKVTRRVTVIVVPKAKTTTQKVTVKSTVTATANPNVKVATSTVTDEQTTVLTRKFTTTLVATSFTTTTKVTTSTISAAPSFHPIKEFGGYVAKKAKRGAVGDLRMAVAKSQYVQRVDCTKRIPYTSIKTTTTVVQGPRKTVAAKTSTKVVTTTQTETSTEYPDDVTRTVTETVSPTVTSFVSVTDVSSSTETVTVETIIPAAEPVYAACGANNMMVTANGGRPVPYVDMTVGFGVASVGAAQGDAYKCCTACMQNSLCFLSFLSDGDGSCTHITTNTNVCPNGQIQVGQYKSQAGATDTYHWMNGPCGYLINGGDVSGI
ncbi:hypothetical protein FPSE_09600 [Fusarium pseudograminearum CS3096]|uniref:Apple domain-containing protein n=1 Tax=Fusarium pseudograminearum (strain CS3096) TaxID=1028729 RepID=K3UF15_FUSPC|nr:hypothetical protein FPSE_09600 [Fusarium pseudograminearum CS3096]EKJ70226.1 hypothetical protein FPSE_09600 [Fusarium pseudograminearum CS3096]KAF0638062.1 hypothetical protein FPSE5266_09600 [Fusarium pseudograminearum]